MIRSIRSVAAPLLKLLDSPIVCGGGLVCSAWIKVREMVCGNDYSTNLPILQCHCILCF